MSVTDDMARPDVTGSTPRAGGSCPAWCTEWVRHGRPGSHVHRSDGRQVPVTQHWWCQDMEGSGTELRCTTDDGIVAFLTMADDDGIVEVVLQHGDMELPHVGLADAEQLARHLLGLTQAAR